MLPPEAKTYFDSLVSAFSSDSVRELAERQEAFIRSEIAMGRGLGGSGFAARLSVLYHENLSARAQRIVEALKKVHLSFNSPLDEDVDAQMLDWGTHALSNAYQGLKGAYTRYLQRFGTDTAYSSSSEQDHAYALAQCTVANLVRQYLWELRNVPTMRRDQPTPGLPAQVTIQNSGTIGSVLTGANSSFNVSLKPTDERRSTRFSRAFWSVVTAIIVAISGVVAFLADLEPAFNLVTRLAAKLGFSF